MLRVTIHDGPEEFRLRLEGRLAGPWVREVELCWHTAQSTLRGRKLTVDLRDVDFVDEAGRQLLAALHEHGARLLADCPMMCHLVSAITGEPEKKAVPVRRKPRLRLRLLSLLAAIVTFASGAEPLKPETVIARYLGAARSAQCNPQDALLSVQIDAKLPKLHKQGRLRALKFISRFGPVSYRPVRFEGDRTVEKNVIERYLSIEQRTPAESLAITPANYRFHFERIAGYNDAPAYVFRLEPKQKRVGLFRGELWLDAASFLPLREWGELVKSPSIFVKRVYFVRDYLVVGGRAVPRRTIADIDTRVAGKAEITVWFDAQCATVEGKPQNMLLGMSNVDFGSPTVRSNACTL